MQINKNRPPGLGEWLLKRFLLADEFQEKLGDFEEGYHLKAIEKGKRKASAWYWLQLIIIIPVFVKNTVYWGLTMIKNYLKLAFRTIKKHKGYSFINIFGLAISVTAFILIVLYVQFEMNYDRYHENSDRIYRIVRKARTWTPVPLADVMRQEFPEVASATRIRLSRNLLVSHGAMHFLEPSFYWVEPQTFEIFSIPFLKGDGQTALKDPSALLLSESAANKYFGNEDPIGKVLKVGEQMEFYVAGVFKDMPANSHFVMDLIAPFERFLQTTQIDATWGNNVVYTYFLLEKGADPEALQKKFPHVIEMPLLGISDITKLKDPKTGKPTKHIFYVQPLTKIHLHSHRMQEISVNNDIKNIMLLSFIAFLILSTACINYINIATARSTQRGKEVGMRKVVGAQKEQLIIQFLSESVVVAILAVIAALILVMLTLPFFNNLMERPLSIDPVNNSFILLGLILITLFVGVFAGFYPAMIISGFKPISVLSGTFTKMGSSKFRNILVIVQFSITIVLLVSTLVVRKQLDYVKNADMGYSTEQIIILPVRDLAVRRHFQAIKTGLLQHANILNVATSQSLPNNVRSFTRPAWFNISTEEIIPIYFNDMDENFIDVFEIDVVMGRNFSHDFPSDLKGAFLVNETAVRLAQWDSPLGTELTHYNGQKGKIVGVMKDFHLHSLHRPIEPLYFFYNPDRINYISIKIKPAYIPATLEYVKKVIVQHSPHYPFDYAFFSETFEAAYRAEQRMMTALGSFSFLAIIIAFLGLFGLSSYVITQRTKEIAIRKSLGASNENIITLLSGTFLRWVVLANVIAWPLAYLFIRRWLENFAFHIYISPWIFIASGSTVLFIAVLSIGHQVVKSARINPADGLRHE